jgi:hypothetical protein
MIAQVRRLLELHGDSRFEDADPQPSSVITGQEFERRPDRGLRFAERFRRDVCDG